MRRVDWSNPALDDLDDIVRHISKDSPYYAHEFVERVFERTDKLKNFPLVGRWIPEADDKTIRVDIERVLILAVIHGTRDVAGTHNKPWNDG